MIKVGSSALLCSSFNIKVKGANEDQEAGINIVRRALHSPARQIATNAGAEAAKRNSGGGGMGGTDF